MSRRSKLPPKVDTAPAGRDTRDNFDRALAEGDARDAAREAARERRDSLEASKNLREALKRDQDRHRGVRQSDFRKQEAKQRRNNRVAHRKGKIDSAKGNATDKKSQQTELEQEGKERSAKFKNPNGRFIDRRNENLLWIVIKAIKAGGNSAKQSQPLNLEWEFLAPNEIAENIGHDWAEQETLASFGQSLANRVKIAFRDLKGTGSAIGKGENPLQATNNLTLNETNRIDKPLVYQNSTRREYTFTFQLIAINDGHSEIIDCVKTLEEYSCATQSDLTSVGLPSFFSINTRPDIGLIRIDTAVITSIQPTYYGPYSNGAPTKCDLTVTFREIDPLFRGNIKSGGLKINTSESGGEQNKDEIDKAGEKPIIKNTNPTNIGALRGY